MGGRQPRRPVLGDEPEHFPYIANSDFHRPKHLYSWKTLVRSKKDWPSLKTALCDNVNLAITLYRGESWVESRARARGEHGARIALKQATG